MPRGVPANGVRKPRAVAAAEAAEAAVSLSSLHDALDSDGPAEDEEDVQPQLDAADDVAEVIEIPVFEMPVSAVQTSAPDNELSPEQREIKALRDQLARERGRKDVEPVAAAINRPGDAGNIVIHFLEDGLTILGKVMYRGDELEFEVDGEPYKQTFDRFGATWLDMRHDEFGQVDRWGKIYFRNGPWPGKTYADGTFEALRGEKEGSSIRPPSADELAAAEKKRRDRAAPRLPVNV